jgi:hypothetical protein
MSRYLGRITSLLPKGARCLKPPKYAVLCLCLVISVIEPNGSNRLLDAFIVIGYRATDD